MAELVKDVIGRILQEFDLERIVLENRLKDDWENLMGQALARQCRPARLEGTTLFLFVRDKAWRDELASNHDQLVNLVKKNTGYLKLQKIIFLDKES